MMLRIHNIVLVRLITRAYPLKAIYIYEGEIPRVDKDFVFNPTTFAGQLLAKTTLQLTYVGDVTLRMSAVLTPFQPLKAGKATWFAIVLEDGTARVNEAMLGTITNDPQKNDPLLLSAINFVMGEAVTAIDFKVKFGV